MSTRLVLADDHSIFRQCLRSKLQTHEGFEVVGEAENGREALALVEKHKPHIVIIDIAMPDLNGVEATRQILRQFPSTGVIALSMHGDRQFVLDMLRAGAVGYLLKDSAYEDLVAAIRCGIAKQTFLSPKIATELVEYCVSLSDSIDNASVEVLSTKEREVLQLLAEGHTSKEIGGKLFVSVKTIEKHRQNIMTKLDIHSVAKLTKYALRHGLTFL